MFRDSTLVTSTLLVLLLFFNKTPTFRIEDTVKHKLTRLHYLSSSTLIFSVSSIWNMRVPSGFDFTYWFYLSSSFFVHRPRHNHSSTLFHLLILIHSSPVSITFLISLFSFIFLVFTALKTFVSQFSQVNEILEICKGEILSVQVLKELLDRREKDLAGDTIPEDIYEPVVSSANVSEDIC